MPAAVIGDVQVADPVVAEPVTGDRTALYMTLHNGGDRPDSLVRVDADGAGRVSLHRTEVDGEVMRMRPVDGVEIAGGGTARLRPGGLHGMVEELATPWAAGDTVRLRLHFARAGEVEVRAPVVPYAELGRRFPPDTAPPARGNDGR